MPQRIDVIVDGRTVNTNQRSDSDAIWKRIRRLSQTARVVEIRRHTAAAPKPSPPPVVTPPSSADPLELARNVCFFATVTDDAITWFNRLPASWKAAFTADDKYPVTDQQIAAVKASGHGAYAWCDCHTTFPETAKAMVRDRELDGWYGEAESAPAFSTATAAAAPAVVGNLSALRTRPDRRGACPNSIILGNSTGLCILDSGHDGAHQIDQLALVAAGGPPVFTNETYRNKLDQRNQSTDWRNANKGVGGNTIAVYASKDENAVYTPVSEYLANGWFNPATDSVYTEGMTEGDWKALLEVAR